MPRISPQLFPRLACSRQAYEATEGATLRVCPAPSPAHPQRLWLKFERLDKCFVIFAFESKLARSPNTSRAITESTRRKKKVVIVNIEHSEHGEQHATIGEVRRHTVRLMYVTLVLIVLLRRSLPCRRLSRFVG